MPDASLVRLHAQDHTVAVTLTVEYTDEYPDSLPKFSLEVSQGDLDEDEINHLLGELEKVVCGSMSRSIPLCPHSAHL